MLTGKPDPKVRFAFQARFFQPGEEEVILQESEPFTFDTTPGQAHNAALMMFSAALQFGLNRVPELAAKQVAWLNATLARLEFVVETDENGYTKLTSRMKPIT